MVATTPSKTPYVPWYLRWGLPALAPATLLALLMLWSVVQSIANANWAAGLQVLVLVALPALLVGVLFARLQWLPGWLAHMLSAALGVAWAVQQVGPLLVREIANELGPVIAGQLTGWNDWASEMVIRTMIWGRIIQAGGRGEDIVLFIAALALLVWALGYTTAWLLFRAERSWWAVTLNAVAILVNYTFAFPKPNALFFVFLGAALLLIVLQQVVQQQRRWQSALIEYPMYMPWRFLVAAALFCGVVMLVTSLLPGNAGSVQVARAWQVMSSPLTAVREGWEVAFSTINAPPGTGEAGFTTRSMRVGGGRILGDAVVMEVRSSRFDYWRAVAFDHYTSTGWQSTVGERARAARNTTTAEQARTPLERGMVVPDLNTRGRALVTQTVTLEQQRNDQLVTVGGMLAIPGMSVLVQHGFVSGQDGSLAPNFEETSAVFSQIPLQVGQTYTMTTLISNADVQSLRAAGTVYPDWVRSYYQQLPESVTPRTRELARKIVSDAGATTVYDQAEAIQTYLRSFVYDERRPAPPQNSEWVDHFLFTARRGYCDDFASAMVVMLRSLDIPARWVQGYAGGTFDPQISAYVVRESVAHSWPEVYFPGFGWQRFEPTPASYTNVPARPAQPEADTDTALTDGSALAGSLDRNLEDLQQFDDALQEQDLAAIRADAAARQQAAATRRLLIAAGVLVALLGGLALFFVVLRRELQGLSPAAATYLRLGRLAGWVGLGQGAHVTPHEYARELGRRLPDQRQSFEQIAGAYVAERYGSGESPSAPELEQTWMRVRRPLLMQLLSRFKQPARAKRRFRR